MRGFVRASAAVPSCGVADFDENRRHVLALWRQAHDAGSSVVVFPELTLSAYTVRDLVSSRHLQQACLDSLETLVQQGRHLTPLLVVGLPLQVGSALYNVAAAVQRGRVLGLVPKSYLPTTREFEEARWFRPGTDLPPGGTTRLWGDAVPLGTDLLFCADDQPDLVLGIEVCEDLWVPLRPGAFAALAGATLLVNPSASNFLVGKAAVRRSLVRAATEVSKCGYLYAASGPGESSTDLAFDADAFVFENGTLLAESRRFCRDDQLLTVDIDCESLIHERITSNSFGDCARQHRRSYRRVPFVAGTVPAGLSGRAVDPHPFLPKDSATLANRCWEIFEIQTNALITRLRAARLSHLVLGVSGGLDSTQAALVAAAALDLAGLPRENLHCVTMPGFGTTSGTRGNAETLSRALGARFDTFGVAEASRLILEQLGHGAASGTDSVEALVERLRRRPDLGDTTLENVQARLRTLLLMTLANRDAALVLGTGDLSEKALGWSTYAGDHISMYDLNCGVPKTLIQFVIRWVANERAAGWTEGDAEALTRTLYAILDTPISPELLPADTEGHIAQLTEETIGPYELHDFFLFHTVRRGARPGRILDLAQLAFSGTYDLATLKRWLELFVRRFFAHQFKRSCTADGPKVGSVALSPRGDWRMPSDAASDSWIRAIKAYQPE